MYKLHMPHYDENDNRELIIIRKLFKEVLGYTNAEIEYFVKTHFSCDVAINLTLEQAQQITQIFLDNDIQIYLADQKNNRSLFWTKDLGIVIPKNPAKSHYCDEPLITRDHLVDAFTEQEKERQRNIQETQREEREKALAAKSANIPTCPTCGSTNIRRISTAEKATGVILFGIFSNKRKYQFECQNPKCKYKW